MQAAKTAIFLSLAVATARRLLAPGGFVSPTAGGAGLTRRAGTR